jgi:hypothetical protein
MYWIASVAMCFVLICCFKITLAERTNVAVWS